MEPNLENDRKGTPVQAVDLAFQTPLKAEVIGDNS